MKFISWNVNRNPCVCTEGIYGCFNELDADIFCIQESKMQAGQLELDMPDIISIGIMQRRRDIRVPGFLQRKEPVSVSYGLGIEEHDKEGRVITLEFEEFYFITVYTPNSQSELARLDYRMRWEDAFLTYLKELEKKKPVIFLWGFKCSTQRNRLEEPKDKP